MEDIISNRPTRLMDPLPKPTPLSPADFQVSSGPANDRPFLEAPVDDTMGVLDAADRISLQVFLNLLRAAKIEAKNPDVELAKRGNKRLVELISYLAGFLDARGLLPKTQSNSGFDLLIASNVKPDMDLLLEQLDVSLAQALTAETRGRVGDAIMDVGWTMVKTGIITEVVAWMAPV